MPITFNTRLLFKSLETCLNWIFFIECDVNKTILLNFELKPKSNKLIAEPIRKYCELKLRTAVNVFTQEKTSGKATPLESQNFSQTW